MSERVVDQVVPVPQIQEQNVEVIKVILQEQRQQMRFFFWQRARMGLWAARYERAPPQSSPHANVCIVQVQAMESGTCCSRLILNVFNAYDPAGFLY